MAKFTTGSQWAESFGETAVSLGKPSFQKSAVFFNIVQKAFDPPPLSFEHHVVIFFKRS